MAAVAGSVKSLKADSGISGSVSNDSEKLNVCKKRHFVHVMSEERFALQVNISYNRSASH